MIEKERVVALVDWSHLIEDFLDDIGVSFEGFRDEMTGGWMFGYVAALARADCRTILICVSARVSNAERHTHKPTGATIWVLPAPLAYRRIRLQIPNPYALTVEEAAGVRSVWLGILREVAPYLATPLSTLASILEQEACNVILCQEYENPRFDLCVLLGRLTGRPVYATFQGGDQHLSHLEGPIRPFTLRAAAGVIVGTAREYQRLRSRYDVHPSKVARIFNPVDLRMWPPLGRAEARAATVIEPDALVVAWHGRIEYRRKGIDILLDAWALVRAARPELKLRLLLVGTGRDADVLTRRLSDCPDPSITWVDRYINDRSVLHRYLAAADVYAFSSRHEGFPVAPVEAMACSLPVVGAEAEGVADIFEEGEESGGLVVPRDDPGAFARALERLLDDKRLRTSLGARARTRVEEAFGLEAVGGQLRSSLFEEGRDA